MSDGYNGLFLLASGWAVAIERAAWQGGLTIALVWLLCRALPRLSGRSQCWLWRLAYLKLLIPLVWTVPVALPLLPAGVRTTQLESPQRHRDTEIVHEGHEEPRRTAVGIGRIGSQPGFSARKRPARLAPLLTPSCPFVSFVDQSLRVSVVKDPALTPRAGLLLLWLLGAAAYGIRLRTEGRRAQRWRAHSRLIGDPALLSACRELCRQFGIDREPALLLADEPGCPSLVGVIHPAVVLPASFLERFSREELHLMLAHELAHLKRRDLLWSWLPNLGRMLFFFHPLVWLAEAEWRLGQEMACDEQVMIATGASRKGYGAMLLAVMAEPSPIRRAPLLTVSVVESYGTVRRRLLALRQARRAAARSWAWTGSLLAITGAASLVPWQLTARTVPQQASLPLRLASAAIRPENRANDFATRTAAAPSPWITIQERRAARQSPPAASPTTIDRGTPPQSPQPDESDASILASLPATSRDFARLGPTVGNPARTGRASARSSGQAARPASPIVPDAPVIGKQPSEIYVQIHPEGKQERIAAAPFSWIGLENKGAGAPAASDPPLSPKDTPAQAPLDPPGTPMAATADDRSLIHLKQPGLKGASLLAQMPPWGLKPHVVALIQRGEKPGLFQLPKPFAGPPESGPVLATKLPPELAQKLMADPSIDHRVLKKLLSDPSLDPRVLKKILAGMALQSAAAGSFPGPPWIDPADRKRFYGKLDAFKKQREQEQASRKEPLGKTGPDGLADGGDDPDP